VSCSVYITSLLITQYAKLTYKMSQLLKCIELQRCADLDTIFNIRFLSVSVKNYLYPYPLFYLIGRPMVQLHHECENPDIFDGSFNIV